MTQINDVEEPAAVIAVPTDEDLDTIEMIIQHHYNDIADEYENAGLDAPNPQAPEWLMREGSLCQEVLAQLHNQMED